MLSIIPRCSTIKNYSKQNFKDSSKNNYVQNNTFQLQQNFKPSFGCIPNTKIVRYADEVIAQTRILNNSDEISSIANNFFDKKIKQLLTPPSKSSEREKAFFEQFRHELVNQYNYTLKLIGEPSIRSIISKIKPEIKTEEQFLDFQKKSVIEMSENVKISTIKWKKIEKWGRNPDRKFPVKEVLEELGQILKTTNHPPIHIRGIKLLNHKTIINPTALYNLVSQPLINAIKYSESKPIEIRIERLTRKGKTSLYASFINPETKPIQDTEIDKILKGDCYRDSNATKSGIKGSGIGFATMVRILKENWRVFDIPFLMEKGRKQGVCVQIPLIGIN